MSTHCSILAWRIPRTEDSGATVHGVTRIGHDLVTKQQQINMYLHRWVFCDQKFIANNSLPSEILPFQGSHSAEAEVLARDTSRFLPQILPRKRKRGHWTLCLLLLFPFPEAALCCPVLGRCPSYKHRLKVHRQAQTHNVYIYIYALFLNNINKPRQHIKKQRCHFADKDPYSQSYGFSRSHVCL